MNKRIIWLIVGLTSLAVLGVVALQVSLLRQAVRANEEQFDKGVQSALAEVADRLEDQEEMEANRSMNGFSRRRVGQGLNLAPNAQLLNRGTNLSLPNQLEGSTLLPTEDPYNIYSFIDRQSLRERLDLDLMAEALRQELQNQGISGAYSYGVYSESVANFIAIDGQLLEANPGPIAVDPVRRQLYASPYQVTLYDKRTTSPGRLIIHFFDKEQSLWSSLWLNFVALVVFAMIILLCFGYTIFVIFRQKKLSEMKNDFINNMTHEFKTPIATISLAADSITSPRIAGDASKVGRFANIIKEENKRMNSQVEKVLQMARIDRREFSLKLTEVDLHDVISRAAEYIDLQVGPRGGSVTTELQATDPLVEGDLTHISSVINNLLDNANKYSPEEPQITISTRNADGGVIVTVSDRGVGMTKEQRKQIFDRFYRVHTGNRHDVKGFGLGLSYVKAIAEAHHGSVSVQSEPGKGSDFILFLPHRHRD
jgi:two-component system phosphate regulon sensor histidine kinase PhoR